ncbi:CASP-like protein 4D1 [Solanum lycopersicum]|uniref:CASP-like protein n=2 Tax=Solanum subgen. Lycopersicon TaxID=49274 RepID=A0A3Q7GZC6_SOLLC|nr:CASP-like protein 4D1 [Solanum lycopersicum]XP_015080266.1 CASP-like protein 4D1 [Solanum pennellii]
METPRAMAILLLRLVTMLLCGASVPIMITNSFQLSGGEKTKYSDVKGYRYVVAAALVGSIYSLIQLPFALYYAVTGKRVFHGNFLGRLDFFVDKVLSFFLASGVGVGFGVSSELKRYVNGFVDTIETTGIDTFEELRKKSLIFFDRGHLATTPLLAGFGTMAVLTIITSYHRK